MPRLTITQIPNYMVEIKRSVCFGCFPLYYLKKKGCVETMLSGEEVGVEGGFRREGARVKALDLVFQVHNNNTANTAYV